MATTHWRKGYSVNQLFHEAGVTWSFYQLVRLFIGSGVTEDDILEELGRKVFFTGSLSRSLPPGEIRRVSSSKQALMSEHDVDHAEKHMIECAYYNIYGLDGPLPEPFSEMMIDDLHDGQGGMKAFINIFNHRIHALRYLIQAQHSYTLASSDASHSYIGQCLLALSGHSLPQQRRLSGQHPSDLIALSGHLANCRLNFPTICRVMQTVLNLPVIELQSLLGRWLTVQKQDQTLLGESNHRLGGEATLGKRVWDQQAAFGLVVGPVSHRRLAQLVPGGEDFPKLKQLVTWLAEKRCDCFMTIVCQPEEKHEENATHLGNRPSMTNRLGYGAALQSAVPQTKRISFMLNIV
ncbi:type VI secretion system baseplate subunit TssG [Vibrio gazogenes]|uniref:Type VI secretion protein, VC_A0111 family n=1 Tax=Vibrio gazogenes DSM 21264 = NBRC 103151 TaxID=1123492 RepID=A0A1M4TFM3_VIBGA|nr:type VI secretion system baseplate subunit TssG [Vibrio gazogenes]USP16083.1 type VI secretion system baseplate subunit TssG [Vibrio gazogenes]SHE43134.1 type VI secretion protein, VC_A0111 family [Vibrio gazogenes DSM 21264] [Vibrio gazogenes DSM 21264 = NBRC 103151]SJN54240.1 hypothetical protein BQ6471_00900 [Vibrio gazogenes]